MKVKKEVPLTYTSRYHWQIAREKLERLFQEEKTNTKVKEKAVSQLEALLKKIGKRAENLAEKTDHS